MRTNSYYLSLITVSNACWTTRMEGFIIVCPYFVEIKFNRKGKLLTGSVLFVLGGGNIRYQPLVHKIRRGEGKSFTLISPYIGEINMSIC